jgi:hypothetical protein
LNHAERTSFTTVTAPHTRNPSTITPERCQRRLVRNRLLVLVATTRGGPHSCHNSALKLRTPTAGTREQAGVQCENANS